MQLPMTALHFRETLPPREFLSVGGEVKDARGRATGAGLV